MTNPTARYKGSRKPDWRTPKQLYKQWNQRWGPFDLDPCTSPDNPLGTEFFFTKKENGLVQSWLVKPKTKFFYNPPYGRETVKWVKKAHYETEKHRPDIMGVGLLPVRTDPHWFHDYVLPYYEIIFLPGRIHFIDPETGYPVKQTSFSNMLVIYR